MNRRISDKYPMLESASVVNTQPYPEGEHPLEKMNRQTAPYSIRLQGLLINLCGSEEEHGVPEKQMPEDFGTGIPKEMMEDGTTNELHTGEYEFITDGEALINEIAQEVAQTARNLLLHEMDTEKIETENDDDVEQSVKDEILAYFDQQTNRYLLETIPDERLQAFIVLNSLRDEICEQVVELPKSINRLRYTVSLKNAINFIIDSVMRNGINESITLQINV